MNLRHITTALRQAWLYYQYDFTVEDEQSGWNEDDAKRTLEFFENTPTGQKLKARMINYVLRSATFALKQENVIKHAGIAEGIQLGIHFLEEQFYATPMRDKENPMIERQEKSEPRRLSPLR